MYEIHYELDKKTETEYKNFLNNIGKHSLLQTPEWIVMKKEWKSAFILIKETNEITGVCLVLIRKIPFLRYSLLYAPRGPVIKDEKSLLDFINAIKELAKKEKAFMFKADPLQESKELYSKYFNINSNYKNFEGIQPRFESVLPLCCKISENDILNSFSSKTRYNIRLAIKKGVQVDLIDNTNLEKGIDEFYSLMQTTGKRDDFTIRNKEYFKRLLTKINKTEEHSRLYIASYNNIPIAGAIVIKNGDSVEYLYGASSNEYRNVMAPYLLQWTAIKDAFNQGYRNYSFGGISGDFTPTNPLYGLYKFKSGFGTKVVEYIGEIELTFNPIIKFLFLAGLKVKKYIK